MYKKIPLILIFSLVGLITIGTPLLADDYYLYVNWNPGLGHLTGVTGYVDTTGAIQGIPGAEYIVFTSGPAYSGLTTAYIYRVETAGDPNMHPDNPDAPGPIAPRMFTFVSSHFMGNNPIYSAHENEFYVDRAGIYYGAAYGWGVMMGCGISHWDFQWNPLPCVVPVSAPGGSPYGPQTLARNPTTGQWWVGTTWRKLFRWDDVSQSWVYQFTYPDLGGHHNDGLEIINNSLFISDMTSDVIIQYRLDDLGNPIDPPGSPYKTFTYSAGPYVEGMGYGPNKHIWISGWDSYTIYEIGGGELQIAIEGIPDQCVPAGDAFDTFDLDDYVAGLPPFTWAWTGNVNLIISVDANNVVTVTYPAGWWGEEIVTFTVTDSRGRSASDKATFIVRPVPVVLDIPDQYWPFPPSDLDDYLDPACGVDPGDVTWTAFGMVNLVVEIDPVTHLVTVTNPSGSTESETITFVATTMACPGEVVADSVGVKFYMVGVELSIFPGAVYRKPGETAEYTLSVWNTGGSPDDYFLKLSGLPPDFVYSLPETLYGVGGNDTVEVPLVILLPYDLSIWDDTPYPFGVACTSVTYPQASNDTTEGAVVIAQATPASRVRFTDLLLDALISQVEDANIPEGVKNSLLSKLYNAEKKKEQGLARLEAGDTTVAMNMFNAAANILGAFINEVYAQRGKKIIEADADSFIAQAEDIIGRLQEGIWGETPPSPKITQENSIIRSWFELHQNYPNPFNPVTQINYTLLKDSDVRLEIYNLLGQKVATLVDEYQHAGHKAVNWEVRDFASGIYFYKLTVGGFTATKKMVISK